MVAGHAHGPTALNAFDLALINAGVGDLNLVRLSSILPPGCAQIEPIKIPPGQLIPCAFAKQTAVVEGTVISAAVGVGIPTDPTQAGLIMEYHSHGFSGDRAKDRVSQMVADGMAARNREYSEILTACTELVVESDWGAVFAGVVLWRKQAIGGL